MSSKIEIVDVPRAAGMYGLAWYADGEEGARLGQEGTAGESLEVLIKRAKKERNFEDYEFLCVEKEMQAWALRLGATQHAGAWLYEGLTVATRARGIANTARKAAKASFDSDVPMPEWAKKALEAGWKMPKGWKP